GDRTGIGGAINVGNASGGTNWPGAGADPENRVVYAQASMAAVGGLTLRKPPAGFSDLNYVSGTEGTEFREALGPGFGTAADSPLAAARGRAGGGPPPGGGAARGGPGGGGGRGAPRGGGAPPPGGARGAGG